MPHMKKPIKQNLKNLQVHHFEQDISIIDKQEDQDSPNPRDQWRIYNKYKYTISEQMKDLIHENHVTKISPYAVIACLNNEW